MLILALFHAFGNILFAGELQSICPPHQLIYHGGRCDYVAGDINGNGAANGIDVTYGASYLKGGSTPKDPCDCPPLAFSFYAAMDVNGNCANGIDITYFVSYLKGQQPSLLYCQECPPASPPVPAVEVPGLKAKDIKPLGGSQ
jgi:hypothetical protein